MVIHVWLHSLWKNVMFVRVCTQFKWVISLVIQQLLILHYLDVITNYEVIQILNLYITITKIVLGVMRYLIDSVFCNCLYFLCLFDKNFEMFIILIDN